MSNKISLTQKYLPQEVWKWLSKKTSYGTTIYDCVVSGLILFFGFMKVFDE